MNLSSELGLIVKQLKQLIISNMELGLDSPVPVSKPKDPPQDSGPVLSYSESLDGLKNFIGDCKRCGLCGNRNNLVFGEGSPQAKLIFVGEAPGHDEDMEGRPFVGEAGKLLTRIIESGMKLKLKLDK